MATPAAIWVSDNKSEGALNWTESAACVNVPVDLFFPSPGDEAAISAAKTFCAACPVIQECLDYAISNEPLGGRNANEDLGIYGGLTYEERRQRARQRYRKSLAMREESTSNG